MQICMWRSSSVKGFVDMPSKPHPPSHCFPASVARSSDDTVHGHHRGPCSPRLNQVEADDRFPSFPHWFKARICRGAVPVSKWRTWSWSTWWFWGYWRRVEKPAVFPSTPSYPSLLAHTSRVYHFNFRAVPIKLEGAIKQFRCLMMPPIFK